ncbi:MAG TPA: hypothetical protein VFD90_10795 [Gaiellales bacterium]|jgi:hypothetical protein|nr:hypothetical protein [Gaiellales bacterium]
MSTVLVPPAGVLDGELREPLLRFVQATFALAARDLANGSEVPFVLDAHEGRESALYSYRPLYGAFLDERRSLILALPDARRALSLLQATPGAVEYARLHVGEGVDDTEALRAAVMWPLAVQIAEREDGFECPDEAFDAIFGPLDRGVAGSRHLYDAMAPLVGVLVSEPPADLGRGVSLVRADVGDIAAGWPEASLLVPPGFGGEPERRCALAVTLELDPGERPPRLADLIEDAVRALRLVSGAAVSTGPVGFERIDGGPRPPVALSSASSRQVEGAYYRFDLHLLVVARATALRIGALDPRDPRREALGLFERALQLDASLQADVLRDALGLALRSERSLSLTALRAGALAGRDAGERQRVRDLVAGDIVHPAALAAAARQVLLAVVLDEQDAEALAASADQVLLGVRPRPNLVPQGIAELPR